MIDAVLFPYDYVPTIKGKPWHTIDQWIRMVFHETPSLTRMTIDGHRKLIGRYEVKVWFKDRGDEPVVLTTSLMANGTPDKQDMLFVKIQALA